MIICEGKINFFSYCRISNGRARSHWAFFWPIISSVIAYGIAAFGTLIIGLLLNSVGCKFRIIKSDEEYGLDI